MYLDDIDEALAGKKKNLNEQVWQSIFMISVFTFAWVIICFLFISYTINKAIIDPVTRVTQAATKLAEGDLSVNIQVTAKDELGDLGSAIHTLAENSKKVVVQAESIAEGNYFLHVTPRSDHDVLSKTIMKMTQKLQQFRLELLEQQKELRSANSQLYTHTKLLEEKTVSLEEQSSELRKINRELNLIYKAIDNASELIVISDGNGRVAFANDSFRKLTGYSLDTFSKESFFDIFSLPEEGDVEKTGGSKLSFNKKLSIELSMRLQNNTFIPILLKSTPVLKQTGSEEQNILVFIITDLSRQKEEEAQKAVIEAQLQQSQKWESIGMLAAGIAHEINTPIQFVGDNTEFLKTSFSSIVTLLDECRKLYSSCKTGKDGKFDTEALEKNPWRRGSCFPFTGNTGGDKTNPGRNNAHRRDCSGHEGILPSGGEGKAESEH